MRKTAGFACPCKRGQDAYDISPCTGGAKAQSVQAFTRGGRARSRKKPVSVAQAQDHATDGRHSSASGGADRKSACQVCRR